MSLEAKLANLTLNDVDAIVTAVQTEGVVKSGLADNIEVLVARCDSKDDNETMAALQTVLKLAENCPEAQAFTKECLGICK